MIHDLEPNDSKNGGRSVDAITDRDNDGLPDLVEYEYSRHDSNPNRKDIFVEVDWMVEHVDAHYGYVKDIDGDGARCDQPAYDIQFKISNLAKFKVIQAFSHHSISLHIDDGCMGGGESIDYHSFLVFYDTCPGPDNDFYDVKWGNFWDVDNDGKVDSDIDNIHGQFDFYRFNIFHYCIFGSSILTLTQYNTGSDSNSDGQGLDHDDLMIDYEFYFEIDFNNQGENYIIPRVFMHELGHNLGLGEGFGGNRSVMQQRNWNVDLDYHSAWKNINYYYSYLGNYR